MSLDKLRKQIDEMDESIVKLIAERMEIAREIGKEKKQIGTPIEDKIREQKVIEKVKNLARAQKLNPEDIEIIYQRIFSGSKETQGVTVAFQGEVGAYSEEAAYKYFGPESRLIPHESLEDVFQAVEKGRVQFGMVPIENSTEGMIARTYDLLLDSSLKICGETQLRIVHCLIGLPESQIDTIKEVYSHPQALGQCKYFLNKMGWKQASFNDTAGSVKFVKDSNMPAKAGIASARSAEIYGMKILIQGIEDNVNNYTRFFVISKQEASPSGHDKTSIVFSVKHKPGALYDALKELAARKINMTKIESRPTRQKPWEYNFYVDIEGHYLDSSVKEALESLEEAAIFIKVLGSYPKVKQKE
jgi:chorismate mutase / prephenate dehydratase